ncbi:hypothetical protein RchiOBHm_Chr5g0014921 [Rosa chinensis]|uniref:Uncharacterized protein n=1 Tax=Rosa chinensis TaxID=74649 RepID=A0A2P6Q5S8_ROSCH|nr:hypothetical protein RchiOBHm_Chr5g0014921 [Rosa chinensis]
MHTETEEEQYYMRCIKKRVEPRVQIDNVLVTHLSRRRSIWIVILIPIPFLLTSK